MTLFRPCIDLHEGRVKQLVGGSLTADGAKENFVSEYGARHYADIYSRDQLRGGHIIQLGPGNEAEAREALSVFPAGLQLGGGVTPVNARQWLEAGASQVIVTGYLFEQGAFSQARLEQLAEVVSRSELVLDLSCRRTNSGWKVATDRWQTVTDTSVDAALLQRLSAYCSEFLVHAADVEGLCQGIDEELVQFLGDSSPLPVTYAGGGKQFGDLPLVRELSRGRVDLTFGSALDLFGGRLVKYQDCLAWNRSPVARTSP